MNIPLAALEAVVDASGAAPAIEALLPAGVRDRQLTARTLLTGMLLVLEDRRPAFLTEVHAALIALPQPDQARLGVTVTWKTGPHQLTYRQVEHTHRLVARALSKDNPDGAPSDDLQAVCDRLLEASIPARHKQASRSLAADWTDVESWSRPRGTAPPNAPTPKHLGTPQRPTCPAPRASCSSAITCRSPSWSATRTARRPRTGPPDDRLLLRPRPCPRPCRRPAAHARRRHPARRHHRRLRLRPPRRRSLGHPAPAAGAQLVQDLHPHDRGPRGTHEGAVIANGSLMGIWQATATRSWAASPRARPRVLPARSTA